MSTPLPHAMRAAVVKSFAAGGSPPRVAAAVSVEGGRRVPADTETGIGNRQVLVRVHAAGLNALDARWVLGDLQSIAKKVSPPYVPGLEAAGVVMRAGAECRRLRPGQAVYAPASDSRMGALAEYVVLDEDEAALKPPSLTFAEAAALPVGALTSLQALRAAGVSHGSRVLILGGSGGCGTLAVQLARAAGAGFVAATCSDRNLQLVRGLGADLAVDYGRGKEAWDELAAAGEFDAVLDAVGGPDGWLHAPRLLRGQRGEGGRFVALNIDENKGPFTFGRVARTIGRTVARKLAWLAGFGPSYSLFLVDIRKHSDLDRVSALVEEGLLRPVIDTVYDSLDDAPAAMAHMATGHTRGKLVVRVRRDDQD